MGTFKFDVKDHDKVEDTINEVIESGSVCHFCQGEPIVIVFHDGDKVTAACKKHEDIVLEMIERAKCCD